MSAERGLLPINGSTTEKVDEWGSITVAQPKIWQFERVSALLDGLLRDIEGVSLTDLTQLDPNAQNAAAVRFVQSALEVGVQYDQSAAVTNGINRSNYQLQSQAAQKRFEADNAYIDLLMEQRNAQTAQLLAAQNTVNSLQPLEDAKTITTAQEEQLTIAKSRVTALTSSLGNTNDAIGKASLTSLAAAPSLTNTAVQPPASGVPTNTALSSFSDLLKSLPQGAQDNLSAALKTPSLPATKKLDNFLTLLYERLAREVSVLQDDLTRSPENVAYLLQFDVGVYPSRKAKNHDARVEFQINCPNCKVYSLYPGQSSYNIANYSGASQRTTLWGNVLTLLGFGASASYRRQVDTLQGSLVQSVYTVGFQNGVLDHPTGGPMPDGSEAVQRFGWYYGAAPFEQVVTPGIRSTFAVVTVPRKDIDSARDILGNSRACMPFQIVSEWARRNDPMRQRESESPIGKVGRAAITPFYKWEDTDLGDRASTKYEASSMAKSSTSVKLPGEPESSLAATREKDRLHVLRMEYNTVFADPPTEDQGSPTMPLAASSANGKAPNPVGNAPAPAAPAATTSGTEVAAYDPLAPCPQKQCAGMLLRLDRPVDPNLVVTVRGEPLKRVRDWRGRATSVLPPAQSGTDLLSSAAADSTLGKFLTKHLDGARSLLETDQAEPNSWFALNSNEIFLNIHRDLATDEEFPVIQLASSEHSLLIPHDLRLGATDLVINGWHMRTPSEYMLFQEMLRTYASERVVNNVDPDYVSELRSNDAPIDAGPYAYTTFVPLFLGDRGASGSNPPVKIYARLGESKGDLMVGFLPREHGGCSGNLHKGCWSEGHTQVILEDHDLDVAWSLSCFVQGEELACHLPRPAMQQVYAAYFRACSSSVNACPGGKAGQKALQFSTLRGSEIRDYMPNQKQATESISLNPFLEAVKYAYVSSLQVWVIQSDTNNDNVFYTAEPAHIDFFPLSDDYWDGTPLKGWQYAGATEENVKVRGCHFFPKPVVVGGKVPPAADEYHVTLLGSLFPPGPNKLEPATEEAFHSCQTFEVPTVALTRGQVVFTIDANDSRFESPYTTPMSIPTFKLAPGFSKAEVTPFYKPVKGSATSPHFVPDRWEVDIPVTRAICGDSLEPHDSVVEFQWFIGDNPLGKGKTCVSPADAQKWRDIDPANGVHLRLTISSSSLTGLPKKMTLVRHSKEGRIVVATLPDLRELLFPHYLTVVPLNPTQFALRGENAGTINAVALQNGSTSQIFEAAPGSDYALVTLPAAPAGTDNSDKPGSATSGASSASTHISVITPEKDSVTVDKNNSTPAPAQPGAATKPAGGGNSSAADKSLGPGTYAVVPLVRVQPPDLLAAQEEDAKLVKAAQAALDAANGAVSKAATPAEKAAIAAAQKELDAAKAAGGKQPTQAQKDAIAAAQKKLDSSKAAVGKATPAQQAAIDKAKKNVTSATTKSKDDDAKLAANTTYTLLTVVDPKGKPLTITIPEAKKPAATPPATPPAATACVAPCVALPCAASCPPPAAAPAAGGKTP